MWRKTKPHVVQAVPPSEWFEPQFQNVTIDGKIQSNLVNVSCEDINKLQLNPNLVNAKSIIENGVPITSSSTSGLLNPTDQADIDEIVNQFAQNVESQMSKK